MLRKRLEWQCVRATDDLCPLQQLIYVLTEMFKIIIHRSRYLKLFYVIKNCGIYIYIYMFLRLGIL